MKFTLRFLVLIGFLVLCAFQDVPVFDKVVLMGEFEPDSQPGFSRVPASYSLKESAYLRTEVVEAFVKMARSAEKDGISLRIISATRNKEYQVDIWERKFSSLSGSSLEKSKEILHYSSMPGTSRHHWGTDFDLNSVEPAFFESGAGAKLYTWLSKNAAKYGFFQPYTKQNSGRTGYHEEKWHWSYYPTARIMLKAYNHVVTPEMIQGFLGAETAIDLNVIDLYVNGIEVPNSFD